MLKIQSSLKRMQYKVICNIESSSEHRKRPLYQRVACSTAGVDTPETPRAKGGSCVIPKISSTLRSSLLLFEIHLKLKGSETRLEFNGNLCKWRALSAGRNK